MTPSRPTAYDRLGGESAVRELVDRFYDHMDSLPDAKGIRKLHAKSLRVSREKLFMFLSGWLGGPALYVETYGHPRLRARHLPFPIGVDERNQWMMCMKKALEEMGIDDNLKTELEDAFWRTADHMRNRSEYSQGKDLTVLAGQRREND